jgi:hypothetical protein
MDPTGNCRQKRTWGFFVATARCKPLWWTLRNLRVYGRTVVYYTHMQPMVLVYCIYLHNWVILFGPMLGFIFQHHGAYRIVQGIYRRTYKW